jgi:pimeloyl-ACP methyl ester carboxylesterase
MAPLLAVEESGSGEPLVLIHGLATTRAIWAPVTPALSQSHRVIALDVPGFGESAPVGEGFDLEAVADRIARGLAARRVGAPFDLVGHSLGAGVALTLAASRPGAVRRLVLVAPAGLQGLSPGLTRVMAAGVDGLLALRRSLAPLADLDWGRRLLLAFAAADGASIAPTQARMMVEASASAKRTSDALATIAGADLRPVLARIKAPLGVIWGAADRTISPGVAELVRAVRPDADVVIIDRAGHVVMVERPEAFATALKALLTRLHKDATTRALDPTTVA